MSKKKKAVGPSENESSDKKEVDQPKIAEPIESSNVESDFQKHPKFDKFKRGEK